MKKSHLNPFNLASLVDALVWNPNDHDMAPQSWHDAIQTKTSGYLRDQQQVTYTTLLQRICALPTVVEAALENVRKKSNSHLIFHHTQWKAFGGVIHLLT